MSNCPHGMPANQYCHSCLAEQLDSNQQPQPPQPEAPELPDSPSGAFWRAWFNRLGALATVDVVNATATLVIAESQAAREDEREQCAKIAEGELKNRRSDPEIVDTAFRIAINIRSRSEHVGE